jgi:transposase-like protein
MMRRSQAEKIEIIHLVEHSELSITKTLEELDVPRSTFYRWYQRYQEEGLDGVADLKPRARQFWNRIPDIVRDQVVQFALEHPDKSSRQLAWQITDTEGYFISESSVYRILKGFDLISSPVFMMVTAKDKYEKPTKRVNELWQTDFTYLRCKAGVGTISRRYWMITPATSWPGSCAIRWAPGMSRIRLSWPVQKLSWIMSEFDIIPGSYRTTGPVISQVS